MLEELFTTKITGKVIEYVISHDMKEFNKKDICDELNTTNPSVRDSFKILKKFHLITETRRIARSKFYKTNVNSSLYKILHKLIMELSVKKFEVELNGK